MQIGKTIKDILFTKKELVGRTIEDRKVQWMNQIIAYAKKNRRATRARMRKNLRMYLGYQWPDKYPSYRAQIVNNRMFANIESALPIVTDNSPAAEIVANEMADEALVEKISFAYESRCREIGTDLLTIEEVKKSLIFGEGCWKVYWNPNLKNGQGDVDIKPASVFSLYPDPQSTDPLMKDAHFVYYEEQKRLAEIIRAYPEKAAELKKHFEEKVGKEEQDDTSEHKDFAMKGEGARDPLDADPPGVVVDSGGWTSVSDEMFSGSEKLIVGELWIKDETFVPVYPDYIVFPGTDREPVKYSEEAQERFAVELDTDVVNGKDLPKLGFKIGVEYKKKYPHGRIIVKCEDVILSDSHAPSVYGEYSPYVRFWCYTVPTKNYFQGMIDQALPQQFELNKRISQVSDILQLTSNPPLIVNTASGIDTKKITNRPGLVIPTHVDVNSAAKWLQVPNFPTAVFTQIEQINMSIDTITGVHDVTQGRKPTGITAGVAIESLQEAAQTRLRLMARYLGFSLQHMTKIMIALQWKYYNEPRTFKKRKGSGWEYRDADFGKEELAGGLPEVTIEIGSSAPINKAANKHHMKELFTMGAITRQELLKHYEGIDVKANIEALGAGGINEPPPGQQVQGG